MSTIFDFIRQGDLANTKQQVLKSGVSQTDGDGWSPLAVASLLQKKEIVQFLLESNANPNKADPKGATPVHQACFAQPASIEILTALLEKGGDCNVENENGSSPLHFAAGRGNVGCVKLCLAFGGDAEKKNKNGKTPLDLAIEKNSTPEVADIIRSHIEKKKSADQGGQVAKSNAAELAAALKKVAEYEKEMAVLKEELEAAKSKIAELEKKE